MDQRGRGSCAAFLARRRRRRGRGGEGEWGEGEGDGDGGRTDKNSRGERGRSSREIPRVTFAMSRHGRKRRKREYRQVYLGGRPRSL